MLDSLAISTWATKLKETRMVYQQLVARKDMLIPWSDLDEDSAYYQLRSVSRKASIKKNTLPPSVSRKVKKNSLRERAFENPLQPASTTTTTTTTDTIVSGDDHEENLELLNNIILDVERLFPGEEFYHSGADAIPIRKQVVEVLYIWCKCHPRIGYKQGFHEILGLIFMNLYKESVALDQDQLYSANYSQDEMAILGLYNIRFICHDLFNIFNKFVTGSGVAAGLYESELQLTKSIDLFNAYLMKIDQFIHYTLTTRLELDTQLWIIRYLRLLLVRELGEELETTSLLWDKLIATQIQRTPGSGMTYFIEILIFLVIQLLIQQKTEIVTSDFSQCLSLLLHYPVPHFASPASRDTYIQVLYRDAIKLYERRSNDLKLFEYGNKLNKKYNPGLKISLGYRDSSELSDAASERSSVDSSGSSAEFSKSQISPATNDRAEKMRYEKLRMEMRLKKKAKQMLHQ
ncbi:hypothetical protein KGF57_001325 [Candida theae]|uniref:Oxidant-induced cell-cycle arrest protein 5 n=1 Tax=Candida theae TaxID=1198502 RepID=A0AAD5FZS4_9ASCO|nr:uncharacterized protein KGF57_001325 [Candida theae]KAI5962886.1 hypothetical protein KGF57_001325 [Candida theae]